MITDSDLNHLRTITDNLPTSKNVFEAIIFLHFCNFFFS